MIPKPGKYEKQGKNLHNYKPLSVRSHVKQLLQNHFERDLRRWRIFPNKQADLEKDTLRKNNDEDDEGCIDRQKTGGRYIQCFSIENTFDR